MKAGDESIGMLSVVLLHELGHAMVHQFKLSSFGRKEDVADQVAVYYMVKADVSVNQFIGAMHRFDRWSFFFSE
jgi:predicted metal-dependent peptidase